MMRAIIIHKLVKKARNRKAYIKYCREEKEIGAEIPPVAQQRAGEGEA